MGRRLKNKFSYEVCKYVSRYIYELMNSKGMTVRDFAERAAEEGRKVTPEAIRNHLDPSRGGIPYTWHVYYEDILGIPSIEGLYLEAEEKLGYRKIEPVYLCKEEYSVWKNISPIDGKIIDLSANPYNGKKVGVEEMYQLFHEVNEPLRICTAFKHGSAWSEGNDERSIWTMPPIFDLWILNMEANGCYRYSFPDTNYLDWIYSKEIYGNEGIDRLIPDEPPIGKVNAIKRYNYHDSIYEKYGRGSDFWLKRSQWFGKKSHRYPRDPFDMEKELVLEQIDGYIKYEEKSWNNEANDRPSFNIKDIAEQLIKMEEKEEKEEWCLMGQHIYKTKAFLSYAEEGLPYKTYHPVSTEELVVLDDCYLNRIMQPKQACGYMFYLISGLFEWREEIVHENCEEHKEHKETIFTIIRDKLVGKPEHKETEIIRNVYVKLSEEGKALADWYRHFTDKKINLLWAIIVLYEHYILLKMAIRYLCTPKNERKYTPEGVNKCLKDIRERLYDPLPEAASAEEAEQMKTVMEEDARQVLEIIRDCLLGAGSSPIKKCRIDEENMFVWVLGPYTFALPVEGIEYDESQLPEDKESRWGNSVFNNGWYHDYDVLERALYIAYEWLRYVKERDTAESSEETA